MQKIFYQNVWFSHFFKFFYAISIIKDFNLVFDFSNFDSADFNYKLAVFNINYLAVLYEINGFTNPVVDYMPAHFLTPFSQNLSKNKIFKIRQFLFLK